MRGAGLGLGWIWKLDLLARSDKVVAGVPRKFPLCGPCAGIGALETVARQVLVHALGRRRRIHLGVRSSGLGARMTDYISVLLMASKR